MARTVVVVVATAAVLAGCSSTPSAVAPTTETSVAQVTVATSAATTTVAPPTTTAPPVTTTTDGGPQGYLADLCQQSSDFCGIKGSEAQGAIKYGQTIRTGLKQGVSIKNALAAEKVVAQKTGLSPLNAVVIVTAAVNDLCPKYIPALEAYANSPN